MTLLRPILCVLLLALLPSLPATAQEVTLYGLTRLETAPPIGDPFDPAVPPTLYAIDPETAVVEAIGEAELPTYPAVFGATFLPDGRLVTSGLADLFVLFPRQDPERILITDLVLVDIGTAAETQIGTIVDERVDSCGRITGLASDPSRSTLYGVGDECGEEDLLYRIDPETGAGTPIGPMGFDGVDAGMTWLAETGELVAALSGTLVTLDPETGAGTAGAATDPGLRSLAQHPVTGVVYGLLVDDEDDFLVTVDPDDGSVTTIGRLREDDDEGLARFDALAFRGPAGCPPAPIGPCLAADDGRSKLSLSGDGAGRWLWRTSDAAPGFGDPQGATTYRMCLYDEVDGVPLPVWGRELPAGDDGWSRRPDGFRGQGVADGIRRVRLRARPDGSARIDVKLREAELPDLPLSQQDRVVLQLANDAGACFESSFEAPARKNTERRFKARD